MDSEEYLSFDQSAHIQQQLADLNRQPYVYIPVKEYLQSLGLQQQGIQHRDGSFAWKLRVVDAHLFLLSTVRHGL